MYSHLLQKYAEKLYYGICTIIEYQKQQGLINNTVEVVVAENVHCRLSYKNISNAEQTDTAAYESQIITLFLPPDIDIKEGSKVIVTQNNETNHFICSGKAAVYGSHKEVTLKLEKRWT